MNRHNFLTDVLQMGARDPSEGGEFVKDVVQGQRDKDVGKVIHVQGIQPW